MLQVKSLIMLGMYKSSFVNYTNSCLIPAVASGLVSRLKYVVSNRAQSAPSTAGLGYGKFYFNWNRL